MNQKTSLSVIISFVGAALLIILVSFTPVEATSMTVVDGDGSSNEVTIYDWADTPWLNLNITPAAGFIIASGTTYWTDSLGNTYSESFGWTLPPMDYWTTLSNWDSVKTPGAWNISGDYESYNPTMGITYSDSFNSTAFTVVPEPISSILFVAGGTLLAGRRYIKRKKKA